MIPELLINLEHQTFWHTAQVRADSRAIHAPQVIQLYFAGLGQSARGDGQQHVERVKPCGVCGQRREHQVGQALIGVIIGQ